MFRAFTITHAASARTETGEPNEQRSQKRHRYAVFSCKGSLVQLLGIMNSKKHRRLSLTGDEAEEGRPGPRRKANVRIVRDHAKCSNNDTSS